MNYNKKLKLFLLVICFSLNSFISHGSQLLEVGVLRDIRPLILKHMFVLDVMTLSNQQPVCGYSIICDDLETLLTSINPFVSEERINKERIKLICYLMISNKQLKNCYFDKMLSVLLSRGHADLMDILLADNRSNIISISSDIINICIMGHHEVLEKLLLVDCNPKNLSTCLLLSANNGRLAVVDKLLTDGRADPSEYDSLCLILSSINGHLDVVKKLIDDGRADPSALESSCLIAAYKFNHLDIVNLLTEDERIDNKLKYMDHLICEYKKGNEFSFDADIVCKDDIEDRESTWDHVDIKHYLKSPPFKN